MAPVPADTLGSTPGTNPCVAFVTMGCAKNEVDTEHMQRRLTEAGYTVCDDAAEADVVVVNTCSFIQAATEESIEAIFEVSGLPRVERGDAKLVVAGCMPARYGDDLAGELTEAAAFVPCANESTIVEVVEGLVGKAHGSVETAFEAVQGAAGERIVSAYVKISDGCDRFCSYCTIPYIRGRYHSFPYADIEAEVARAVGSGVREIVLIAQDTGRWGADFDEPSTLASLMARLAETFPDTWLRVMYLQPEGVTDELLDVMASHGNICPYLDIPLQHADPDILRAMNRTGSAEEFLGLMERIRTWIPSITLRTTLIAGFPGETDEQFDAMCELVEEAGFDYVGVFPYSREEGTRAYDLPGQLDEDEKRDRAQRLRDLADAVCVPALANQVGEEMDVLVEGVEEDGQRFGRAMRQAPEVDGSTYVDAGEPGDIVRVRIVDSMFYELEGEAL